MAFAQSLFTSLSTYLSVHLSVHLLVYLLSISLILFLLYINNYNLACYHSSYVGEKTCKIGRK